MFYILDFSAGDSESPNRIVYHLNPSAMSVETYDRQTEPHLVDAYLARTIPPMSMHENERAVAVRFHYDVSGYSSLGNTAPVNNPKAAILPGHRSPDLYHSIPPSAPRYANR